MASTASAPTWTTIPQAGALSLPTKRGGVLHIFFQSFLAGPRFEVRVCPLVFREVVYVTSFIVFTI